MAGPSFVSLIWCCDNVPGDDNRDIFAADPKSSSIFDFCHDFLIDG